MARVAHQRERGGGLARARFADERQHLAGADREAQLVDQHLRAGADAQFVDDDWCAHQRAPRSRARRPGRLSMTRLTAIVRLAIASAGAITDGPPSASAPMFSRTSEPQSAAGG